MTSESVIGHSTDSGKAAAANASLGFAEVLIRRVRLGSYLRKLYIEGSTSVVTLPRRAYITIGRAVITNIIN